MSIKEVALRKTPEPIAGPSFDPARAQPPDDPRGDQQSRAALIFEYADIGIAEVDADGTFLHANPRLCELMRLGLEELRGRSIFDDTHPDDAPHDREQFRRQIAGKIDRYTIEKRIRRNGEAYVWASVTSTAVRGAHGEFRYAIRAQTDISRQKQTEEALARSLADQAALYDFTAGLHHIRSPDAIYDLALDTILQTTRCQRAAILLLDASGTMRFVAWRGLSESYRRAVDGHSPWTADSADPQPICFNDIAGADFPAPIAEAIAREGIAALCFIPLQQNGRLIGKFMTYYDAPHRFSGVETDIAVTFARQLAFGIARVRSEEARRSAERAAGQLAAIVESSDDAIVSKDLDGVIRTWNRAAERLFGYTADEAIGQSITILIPPERMDEEPEILARIRRGDRIDHYETVRRHKSGTSIDISLTVSPIRDATGTIVGASKIARDITERKQAETQQRVLLNELNHRVKNNMQMLHSLLNAEARRARHPEAKRALIDATGRIAAMGAAQRVLYGTTDATRCDIDEFVQAICETAQLGFPENVDIVCEVEPGKLSNDAAMPVALILNELLTNAVKHGSVAPRRATIRVGVTREDGSFILQVEDEGPGFDLHSVRPSSSGLRLVEGLARQLRGTFEVVRTPATRCVVRFAKA